MKTQRGFATIYMLIGLIIALGITGIGLFKQVQANGVLKANNAQLEQTIKNAEVAYKNLQSEKAKVEVITIDNLVEKEVIIQEKEVVKYRIREVIKNAPPESCLNQPIDPGVLECLRTGSCGSPGTPEDVSSYATHVGYTLAGYDRRNIWRPGPVRY